LGEHLGRVVDGRSADGRTGSDGEGDWRDSKRDLKTTSADRGWNAFQELVEKELEREVGLIGPYHPIAHPASAASTAHSPSFTTHPAPTTAHTASSAIMQHVGWGIEQDMHVISSIEVHEIFKRSSSSAQPAKQQDKGKKVAGMTVSPASGDVLAERQGSERAPSVQEKRKTLADYVNFGRMKVVRDNCQRSYGTSLPFLTLFPFSDTLRSYTSALFTEYVITSLADDHQAQYSSISNDVFALQSATDQIAQSIEGLEVQLEHEVAEIVGHAEAVVEEARLLVLEDPGESGWHLWE
jgi:hypothetical protein